MLEITLQIIILAKKLSTLIFKISKFIPSNETGNMQFSQSNNKDIVSKVLVTLIVIPVAAVLIIIVIPLLLIVVTIFWCFMYFSKKKYENASYYKYINKKFSSMNNKPTTSDENPYEAIIDAKYKSLEDGDLK